ncbi:glutathione S-transferase family protein [Novosphingobium mangrovi (ex Huang et al. 2023)]|uniref:Glutathione S-transferase N-terminal domain-containing protein n=1 Tax=Novosphingobium mangrovi (ex Huang et al. 2023) TaxID=2976432 RepID=A0ABT2I274_9SPHN|nr:glutathione S-transferase [Novosphingobium mangrovi (ex Huang et al. 2023)]MCT2398902.1 glutathione S-transferase N-terminal domain-containing protein [Novosphingobium mangrovi (ex Huang et al. 2023)]
MANMCLYMAPGSCSTAANIILEEVEEVFEVAVIDIPAGQNRRPEYLAINPRGTIPSLRLRDGSVLTDLVTIAEWLGRNCRRGRYWPADPALQERARAIMHHVTGVVHGQGFARVFVPEAYGCDPQEAAQVIAEGRRIAAQALVEAAAMLDAEGYALGTFTVADPILFYVEFWADMTDVPLPPRLLDHYRFMLGRDAVYRVLREEGYDPGRLGKAA